MVGRGKASVVERGRAECHTKPGDSGNPRVILGPQWFGEECWEVTRRDGDLTTLENCRQQILALYASSLNPHEGVRPFFRWGRSDKGRG